MKMQVIDGQDEDECERTWSRETVARVVMVVVMVVMMFIMIIAMVI